MTGLYTLDSAALHARLGLLAALASARKNLMLLPSGGGSGAALQRLQLVGEIARVRKELGAAGEGRPAGFDHGMLNLPLDKRGGGSLESQIIAGAKRFRAKEAADRRERFARAMASSEEDAGQARALWEAATEEMKAALAEKLGLPPRKLADTMERDFKRLPQRALERMKALYGKFAEDAGDQAATSEDARAELGALTAEAQRRMAEAAESAGVGVALSGAEIDYLTPEEKARRHELLEQLREPDSAEQARERVQERIKARREAAAELPQAKRRNRPLEYTGYSGQARSVRSYYEAGDYRIAKPHEGLFEVIDKDGQAVHQMAGLGGALSVVQRLGGEQPTTWEKLHAKVWKGSNGMYIVDESFASGGRPVKMFAVYASQDDRHAGNNFTSGESLTEAKRKAAGVVLDDASLQLDSTGGMDRLALLAELRRAMDALAAADDPAVRLDLLVEVARLRKALGTGADASAEPEPAGDPDAFVEAPGGGLDFGEITAEMAQAAGRQPGRIRLQVGNASWGMMHIEQRHGAEIRSAGFPDVQAFVADVARHIDQVWKPATTRQLVVLHKTSSNLMMFVELQPGRDDAGDFYTVNTAFASRKAEKKGWKLLWEARAQASGDSGNRPPFAVPPQ